MGCWHEVQARGGEEIGLGRATHPAVEIAGGRGKRDWSKIYSVGETSGRERTQSRWQGKNETKRNTNRHWRLKTKQKEQSNLTRKRLRLAGALGKYTPTLWHKTANMRGINKGIIRTFNQ